MILPSGLYSSACALRIGRRRAIAFIGLGALSVFEGANADAQAQVPPFSNAPPGADIAPGWRHQTIPKVERANQFTLLPDDGQPVVKVSSSSSASSWLTLVDVDPSQTPVLKWRWKVSRALPGSDLKRKAGDDYAARLYVFFDLPIERLSLGDRLRIQAARLLSGAEVPAAALCYVWGSDQPVGSSDWNPYTDRVRMIVVDSGDQRAGQWQVVSRDVERDWADAFGGSAPRINGVAISADTDNTGDTVTAWFGDLRFMRKS